MLKILFSKIIKNHFPVDLEIKDFKIIDKKIFSKILLDCCSDITSSTSKIFHSLDKNKNKNKNTFDNHSMYMSFLMNYLINIFNKKNIISDITDNNFHRKNQVKKKIILILNQKY